MTVNASSVDTCSPCHVFSGASYTPIGSGGVISTSYGPGNYYIASSVTITGTDTFTDAIVLIAPGVTVSVNPTATLTLAGCHLRSCGGMWQGIVLDSSGALTGTVVLTGDAAGNSTLIEDAINAVYVQNPQSPATFITSNNTIFNKNNTGIKIVGYNRATTTPTTYTGLNVTNTVFTSRQIASTIYSWPSVAALEASVTMPSPYMAPYAIGTMNAMPCFNNGVTTGISLNGIGAKTWPNCGSVQVGAPATGIFVGEKGSNLFDTLNVGISAVSANATIINNYFAHMAKNSGAAAGGGIGVYANVTDGRSYQLTVERGVWTGGFISTYSPNYFWNCPYGVYVLGYAHVTGLNSQMVTTQSNAGGTFVSSNFYGYFVQTSAWDTINISTNTIINVANGIAFKAPGSGAPYSYVPGVPGQVVITNNNIVAKYTTSGALGTAYVDKPIWAENDVSYIGTTYNPTAPPPPQMNIDENVITDAYNGIYVNRPAQVLTSNVNKINLIQYASKAAQYGINHNYASGDQVSNNTIVGTDYTDTAWCGVLQWYSNGSLVNCNKVTNIGTGFEFDHNSLQSYWLDNIMTNNGRGLALGGNIGTQQIGTGGASLNQWRVTAGSGFAWSSTYPQTYTHYGVLPSSSPLVVNTWDPVEDPVNNQTGWLGSAPSICLHRYGCTGGTVTGLGNGLTASTVAVTYECVPVTVVTCCSGSTGAVMVAQNNIPYSQWAVQHSWSAQFQLWETLLQDSAMADTSALIVSFKAMARNSRFALFTKIDSNLAMFDTLDAQGILNNFSVDSMANALLDTATGAQMADDTLADAIVVNYRTYYQLYIHYLEGVMSNSDSLQVGTLAALCPITGGGCVFRARALYDVVFDTLVFFPNICNDTITDDSMAMRKSAPHLSPVISNGNGLQKYVLLPNPNNGNFELRQGVADEKPVAVEIWDAIGRSIYKGDLHFNGAKTNLQMMNAVPGLYLMQLTDSQGRMFKFKFIVE